MWHWNNYTGSYSTALIDVNAGQALGKKNHKRKRQLKIAVTKKLVVGSSRFEKRFCQMDR